MISLAIQRGATNVIAVLPHLNVRTCSLDVLLRNVVPFALQHFDYLMLKGCALKDDEQSLLHPIFMKKLADCKNEDDFKSLANEVKMKLALPQGLNTATNLVKFKQIMFDYARFCKESFHSEITAKRITQITEFAVRLAQNGIFRNQMYEHAASVFALLDQQPQSILIHFDSLLALGSLTNNLARLYQWDEDYIERVQNLYKMNDHDAQVWVTPFNKYLAVQHDFKNAAAYFKLLLNDVVKPDQHYNLKRVNIPLMSSKLQIWQDDLKMMTLRMDLMHVPGTIHSLERTYSTSTQIVEDEQMSTVEEILRKFFNKNNEI